MGFLDRMLRGSPPPTPEEVDRITVRRLQGMGADLSKPRQVLHFLNFAAEPSARGAAEALERAGYATTVTASDDTTAEWSVRAEGSRVIDANTVVAFRSWFERLAVQFHGEYEGWEAWPKP